MTEGLSFEEITDYLLSLIPKEEYEKAMLTDMSAECDGNFMGFVEAYYYLSKFIPKDWTVIDFGAAYNSQSYFFTSHKRYIAVNPPSGHNDFMFKPSNCDIYRMTTGEFLKKVDYPSEKVFAICNYVPNWYGEDSIKLVHENFRNCYTFYPEGLFII